MIFSSDAHELFAHELFADLDHAEHGTQVQRNADGSACVSIPCTDRNIPVNFEQITKCRVERYSECGRSYYKVTFYHDQADG